MEGIGFRVDEGSKSVLNRKCCNDNFGDSRCLLDKQCSWQSKQASAKRSMEIQPAALFLDLMTAVGKEDFGWLIDHVICSKYGEDFLSLLILTFQPR